MRVLMQETEDERTSARISELTRDKYHTIYGVVVDWLEWRQCKGTDFMMTLDLIDECMTRLSVKIFSPTKIFPKGFCVGDVVRVGSVKLYGNHKALTDRGNDVRVMSTPSALLGAVPGLRVRRLAEFYRHNRKKFVKEREVSEIEGGQYFDFNGELIDKQRERSNLLLLRLVDYSANGEVKDLGRAGDYPSSMVLVIKAWGCFAAEADRCEIGGWYRIRNLKADEVGHSLSASLSESSRGGISEIGEGTVLGKSLAARRDKYQRGFIARQTDVETPRRMERYALADVRSTTMPGVYRVRVQIKRYVPLGGTEVSVCKTCGTGGGDISGACRCCGSWTPRVKALKLLIWDGSEEIVAVCRNRLAEHMLSKENDKYLNGKMFDCVILAMAGPRGVIHHIVDLGFLE